MPKNSLKLVAFNNELFGEVRTVDIDGKIYFVAKDVAKALGYVIKNIFTSFSYLVNRKMKK